MYQPPAAKQFKNRFRNVLQTWSSKVKQKKKPWNPQIPRLFIIGVAGFEAYTHSEKP